MANRLSAPEIRGPGARNRLRAIKRREAMIQQHISLARRVGWQEEYKKRAAVIDGWKDLPQLREDEMKAIFTYYRTGIVTKEVFPFVERIKGDEK